ncbi:hypothetical protein C4Q31_09375 [Leptospira borgpetersenii serovar Ceylonica]|nr:hypothetical protein C4Q31_09375 [Leptospira borgpetersenii serovar Ceylonica]
MSFPCVLGRWEDSGDFLYQKIILFASKKPYSCRNTSKNVRFDSYYSKILLNLWVRLWLFMNRLS